MIRYTVRAVALAFALVFLAGCEDSMPAPSTVPTSAASSPIAADTSAIPFGASSAPDAGDIKTLADAIASARGEMADTQETFSDGAQDLVLWAQDRLEWKDLAAVPVTKAALVMKDSDEQFGKRICASGMIVEISAVDIAGKAYVGEIVNEDSGNTFRFIALRSTGDIVQQSDARFCGIVTGKVDYANSMGGETHAIQLVGMFDLPENHKPVADD